MAHLVNWFGPNITQFTQLLQNNRIALLDIGCLGELDQTFDEGVD